MNRYYYSKDGSDVQGPIAASDLIQMRAANIIGDDVQICEEASESWQPISILTAGTASQIPRPPSAISTSASRSISIKEISGTLMIAIPLVASLLIWLWVGNMSLLQNPSSTLTVLVILTILTTAILGAVEANQLGIGSDADLTVRGKKRSGPAQWFAFLLLLWIVALPSYLYCRRRYGRRNYLVVGICAALLFTFVAYGTSSTIGAKKQSNFQGEQAAKSSPQSKISEEGKSRILSLLEKATKLDALTRQGVSHDAFTAQLAEVKSLWDTLQVSGWPEEWTDEKRDFTYAIIGWDFANDIWNDRIRNDDSYNFWSWKAGAKYGQPLADYCKAVVDQTSDVAIADQFKHACPASWPGYIDKDQIIPWCFAAASTCFERAKNHIGQRLKP